MRIVERLNISKKGRAEEGEDIIFVSDDFAAVIDGATSVAGGNPADVPAGRKAAELIRDELKRLPREADAAESIRRLDSAIGEFYTRTGRLEDARRNYAYRCGASVIIYSDFHRQLWRVGDCKALIGTEEWEGGKLVDHLLSELRSCYLESELRRGKTIENLLAHDTAREYLREMLVRQMEFQNAAEPSVFNFEVVDGFFRDPAAIERFDLPAGTGSVVLASDGYPVLRPTLAGTEDELLRILRDDPLCFRKFKTTKGVYSGNTSFDDRSYLKIDVSGSPGTID